MKSLLWKRALCCLLSMILILGNIPVFSFAEESDGLCEHHTVHTSECGYSPAIPGSPCTHEHTQDCYQTVAECIHVHNDTCGYNEEAGDSSCTHVCSEEYGCFKLVPDCHHAHDESCGYVEAAAEQPCSYACTDCAEAPDEPSEPEVDEAVEAVRTLIEALPTLEEIKAMSMAEQSEVYKQVQEAYNAYNALTDDQKAQLPEAEEIFTSLFEYFNTLTAPASGALASGTCGDALTWALTDDGVLTISGSGKMNDYDGRDAPWEDYSDDITTVKIDSGVETIGYCAFAQCPNLTGFEIAADSAYFSCVDGVLFNADKTTLINYPRGLTQEKYTIPDTVTEIDGYAFIGPSLSRNRNLKTLEIPASVVYFGEHALEMLGSAVTSVPGAIRYAGSFAFHRTSIQEVTIAEGAKSIYEYAFANTSLKKVTIPSTMKYVYNGVFFGTNLQNIYYSGTCSQWNAISISLYDNSVLKTAAFHPTGSSHVKVDIPAKAPTCTATGLTAGEKCSVCGEILTAQEEIPATGHTEQIIPGKAATCTESGLTDGKKCSVCGEILDEQTVIPASHSFAGGVCSGCGAITGSCGANGDNLTYILTTDGKLTISGSGKMADYLNETVVPWYSERARITSVVLMDGVTSIGRNVFYGYSALTSVTIPDGVSSIGDDVFRDCSSLTSVTIPGSVSSIGKRAFDGCSGLTSFTIPDRVTSIGEFTFGHCTGLTSLSIPEGVASIGVGAFYGCSGLTSVSIPASVTSIGSDVFTDCSSLEVATFAGTMEQWRNINGYIPAVCTDGTLLNYGNCGADGNNLTYTLTGDGVLTITGSGGMGDYVTNSMPWYKYLSSVTSIRFSGDISSIGNYAFYGCAAVTSVTIPDSVTSLGANCFARCSGLKAVTLSKNITSYGYWAFSECTGLSEITIPEGIETVGFGCFYKCTSLTSVTLPNSLTSIGSAAFRYCSSLSSVTIPQNVTSIDPYAFSDCTDLKTVYFQGNGITGYSNIFNNAVTAYYPKGNTTWTSTIRNSYGTNVTWVEMECTGGEKHVTVTDPGKAATCTETGLTEGSHCSVCGEVLVKQEVIPAKGHTEETIPGKAATCTETGLTDGAKCSVCGEILTTQEEIPAAGHTEESIPGKAATCTEGGLTEGTKCSVCGEILTAQEEIPATDHTKKTVPGTAATCEKDGLTDGTVCSVCGAVLVEQTVIPAAHTLIKVEGKDATCTGNGVIAHYRCKVCRKKFADESAKTELSNTVIPAGHRFDENHQCTLCGKIGGEWGEPGTWELVDGCLTIQGSPMIDQLCPALSVAPWGIYGEDIHEIVIGNNIGISENAFANLPNLEAVTISATDGIRDNAFAGCGKLNTITFTEAVPFAISQTAFTGVTATAHYKVESNTQLYSNLQNYGGNLTWVEHGDNAKRIEIILYGSSGGVGSFVVQTYPNKTTADCEFTLSAEGVIELTSQYFRGATFRELSPGEVTVTARDKSTGLTASCTIFVADTQPKDIDCPYEEEILIDGTIIRREYRFIPQTTGYYASYNSYMGEAGGITVTQGDSWVDRVSSQYIPSDGEYGVYYLTAGETYSISLECDSWYYGTYATFRWTQPETQVTSVFFEEEEFHFDLAPGTQDQSAWASAYVTPGECLGKLTWSIGDSTVAEIQSSDGNNCCLTLKKAGTTTLTASCGDKNASVPLVVHSTVELKLNQTAQLNHYKNTYNRMVQFTAEEDGQYVFTVQGASSVSIDGQMQYPNGYGTDGNTYFTKVSAGQTVVLRLGLHEDSSAAVSVAKAESKPDSMELICLSNNQHKVSFGVSFSPATSMDKIVSWTVSDPDLLGELSTYDSSNSKQSYIPYAKGQVTVTATSASGLSASCTLTVGRCFDGHTNASQDIAATCTTGGFTINTCSVCGEITITSRVGALGHDLTHYDAQAATCTEDGWNAYDDCSRCDYTTYEEIPATGHTLSHVNGSPATCKEAGVKEHYHCSNCGKDFEDENGTTELTDTSIPAKDHTEETIPGKAATCTEPGLTDGKKCSVCGEILEAQQTIPASHNFVDGVCSKCGAITGICGANGDNLTYVLTTDGKLTISGSGKMADYSESSPAPWYSERARITSVVLTDGVTSIGYSAFFGCSSLTSVTIPEGVTTIGGGAFENCSGLTSVTIPDGVSSIGYSAFENCSGLTSVTIPDGVSSIGSGTFSGCSGLTSVTIPDSVSSIGERAFYGCSSLTSVTIPKGVTSIGGYAFRNCSGLTSVTIPEGVTSIRMSAFEGCSGLTSVTIPDSVSSIGSSAFEGCSSLTSVTIPDGVSSIGSSAFEGCSSLTSVTIPDGVSSIESGTFSGCSGLTSVTIPKGVTAIGGYAFYGCSGLTSVTIPEGVTAIRSSAFSGCSKLTSVTIPDGVTSIESGTFSGCSGLTSVTIPKGVTAIGNNAFYKCSSLTSVTIPDGVTSIESGTFHSCSSLTSVTIPKSVTSIGDQAFYSCSSLTNLTIPDSVTSIGGSAFHSCSSLTSVTIPKGVSSIEYLTFCGCSSLTSVTISEGVSSIERGSFSGCSSLTTVQFLGDGFTGADNIFMYPVTAYYPHGNTTWTQEIRDSFTSRVTWKEACIGALEHTEITDEAKAPTCTETGLTEGSHCSVCGTVLVAQEEISATGHTLTMVEGKEATCTEAGVKAHYHCSVCDKDFEDENGTTELADTSIPAEGHSLAKVERVEPSCTEDGVKAHYHCSVCDKNFEDENGTKEMTDTSIPTVEHEWGEWEVTTPATPEAEGVETRKCASCQQEETRPLAYTGNRVELAGTGLENEQVVWIDGVAVPVQKDGSGNSYVTLPENSSSILVTYSFNTGSGDRHTQYPTGMKVYRVEKTDSGLTVAHLPELDNLLQYSGCSIRIVGVKGIRMITSISKSTRSALMGDGLAGYKLVEYGTALCRASALEGGAPMVLGTPGVKSNYAYKRGVADPIFKDTGSLIQYTNVLVGFTDEDCKEDIAMRPYIILEDEKGETVTLYGGTVYRSIGYIAYQNRSAFAPGTAAYDYVWNIIHYVYGDQYDADYKG